MADGQYQDPPVDEFGIPIKKKGALKPMVDEFGIPVKKKGISSFLQGVGSAVGNGLSQSNGKVGGTSKIAEAAEELTPESKLKSLGLNITFSPDNKPFGALEPPKEMDITSAASVLGLDKPRYVNINNANDVSRLIDDIDKAVERKRTMPGEPGFEKYSLKYDAEYSKAVKKANELKETLSYNAQDNAVRDFYEARLPVPVNEEDLLRGGRSYIGQLSPVTEKRNKKILEGGEELGEENEFNAKSLFADILINNPNTPERDREQAKALKDNLYATHPKYAVAKAWDIIGAFNHIKDNRASGGIWRSRPTLGMVKKWMEDPELQGMFVGNEAAYDILKTQLSGLPAELNNFRADEVAVGGFLNKFAQAIGGGFESVGNIGRGDAKRLKSIMNPTMVRGSFTGNYGLPGQSAAIQQEFNALEEKKKEGHNLTEEEEAKHKALSRVTGTMDWVDRTAASMGDLTGQVGMQILLSKGAGVALKPLAGATNVLTRTINPRAISATTKMQMGVNAGVAISLSSYDQTRQQAVYNFPDDPTKQDVYTVAMTAANALSERIFKDEKALRAITNELKRDVAGMLKNVSVRNISKADMKRLLSEKIIKYGKQWGIEGSKEASEEAIVQAVDEVLQSTMWADDYQSDKAAKRIGDTFFSTLLNGALVSGLAARTNVKQNQLNKVGLYKMAENADYYADYINRMREEGHISQSEADEKIRILTKGAEIAAGEPEKVSAQNTRKRAEYFTHQLNVALNEEKLANSTDKNEQAEIQKEIKQSEEAAKEVYESDTQEQEILKKGAKDIKDPTYRKMAEDAAKSPETASQFIQEVREQATGAIQGETDLGNAREGIVAAFGNTIADFVSPPTAQVASEKIELENADPNNDFANETNLNFNIKKGNEVIGDADISKNKNGNILDNIVLNDEHKGKGYGKEAYRKLNEQSISETGNPLHSSKESLRSEDANNVWKSLVKSGEAELLPEGIYRFKPKDQSLSSNTPSKPSRGDVEGKEKKETAQSRAKKVYKDIGEIDEPTDARGLALEYLAGGNKVNESVVDEVANRVKRASLNTGAKEKKSAEVKARDYTSKDAPTIDEIVHSIWDNLSEEVQSRVDIQDLKNELMDVVRSHNTRLSAATEFRDRYIAKDVMGNLSEAEAKEMNDLAITKRTKIVQELPESQQTELLQLIEKYEDKYGNVDWAKLEKDSNGFDPDILSLSTETQQSLDAIIQKNISEAASESRNTSDKDGVRKKEEAEERLDSAISNYNKAVSELTKAENKISNTQASQSKLFDATQKEMFGVDRDAAKEILDPLRKKVKETKSELDDAQKAFDNISEQPELNLETTASKVAEQPELEAGKSEIATQDIENQPPEPPKPPQDADAGKDGEGGLNDKGVLNRLYNAKGTPQAAKEGFKAEGLEYQTKSQEEAESVAKSVVDELGVNDAVLAAEAQKFDGDVNSLIFAEALNRLAEQEAAATTPEAKLEAAIKFKDVGTAYDKAARKGGRFNSAINKFYKKSPLGIVIMENTKRKDDFNQWSKPKDKSWKEFHEEMMKDPEYEAIVKEQVKEGMKQERAEARKARIKKVDDFFDKAKDEFKGNGALYSTVIPPKLITAALEGMKQAYHAGEKVAEIIEKAIDYISDGLGGATWDKDKFRKEWEEKLKEKPEKKPLTDEEVKARVLDKFRNKLKGLSDKQKEEVVVKAHRKIIESGGLDYQDFKDIIAGVLGRGELTKAEADKMQEMVKKINAVDDAATKARTDRTEAARREFRKAEFEAGIASKDLSAMLYTRPNITKRLTTMMQLNTLGIPALINNPVYNVVNQLGLRFPVGVVKSGIDKTIQGIGKLFGKDIQPETNVFSLKVQREFFSKLGLGTKEAATQFLTGLNRMDYTQKELYGQQIRPAKSVRDLYAFSQGKLKLTPTQVIDKMLQASPQGWTAELIARTLNLGDKPQRFAAEGAQAAAFAKGLGLKGIDYDLFIDFPREEAYMQLKKQGLSDEAAGKKADYIADTIIKEGERSTFQQDNFVNDILTKIFGGEKSGVGSLAKATIISPYIKIPTNAFWSYFNIVNPEIALLQSMMYSAKGVAKRTGFKERFLGDRYNTTAEKDFNEAKYWFAHAAVGVATRAVIISLVAAGVFRPGNDEDDTKKEREGEANYEQQGSVNMTKLWAWINGKDPSKVEGGMTVPVKWLGHWGSVGNTIAKKNEEMTPEQREHQADFWNTMFGGMELPALQEFEQGIFANTSSLMSALNSNGGQGLNWWGVNTINMFANIVHPAALAQISRAELPYYTTNKADNFGKMLKNSMLNRSSVIRSLANQYPPSKIGIWGEPIEKKGDLLEKLFNFKTTTKDNFAQPIYEDYIKTGDIGYFPPAVMPILNDKKLNTEQTRKLETYVGTARKNNVAFFINDAAELEGYNVKYSQLNPEQKKKVLQYEYQLGREQGVDEFYKDYPEFKPTKEVKQISEEIKEDLYKALRPFRKKETNE